MHILDTIGSTPLLELPNLSSLYHGVKIYAKAEFMNPSGSVKDRAAKAMILDGIHKGLLTKDKYIIDATSGNTGIAYAMIGAALGYKVVLYMPANTSLERKGMMRHLGAEIVETDPLESSDGALIAAQNAVAENPSRYFYPDQYNNPANVDAHYRGTGMEIWKQTNHSVTHFVSVMGTSGTFTGTSKRLKAENPQIRTLAIQPTSPFHGIEGTKHMGSTIRPGILDESVQDAIIEIDTDTAYDITRRLALEEGIFVGISSGANVAAAMKIAETAPHDSVIVTILCDSGSRYTADEFWEPVQAEVGFDWKI
ncbi:MAG: PLP-dependent cysteine synthase family protein [Clostridiales Family XIII bacterium]|jgi:cysteine synthase B|nr:PLP-dependent cysteine synthase family protein [Clostridiales Family XIII bacterium]